jgi:hypothetical protein
MSFQKKELRHYVRNEDGTIYSTPADKPPQLPLKDGYTYLGLFSKYNPIAFNAHDSDQAILVVVQIDLDKTAPRSDLNIPDLNIKRAGGYHSPGYNHNSSLSINRQQLLKIADLLQESDRVVISSPDSYDESLIKKSWAT